MDRNEFLLEAEAINQQRRNGIPLRYVMEGTANDPLRELIREQRLQGCNSKEIAELNGISEVQVIAYCDQLGFPVEGNIHLQYPETEDLSRCKFCGQPLIQPWRGGGKQFCDSTCREKWRYQKRKGMSRNGKGKDRCVCDM